MAIIVAFDIGGVIVDKMTRKPFKEALMSIKLFVEKLGKKNVFILSKAKNKWILLNLKLFDDINFYKYTGVLIKNIIFVDEYIDKQTICKKHNINYMIDDSVKVIRFMQSIDTVVIWFGNHNKIIDDDVNIIYKKAKTWKHIRKILNKI
tara:strand:- start:98 stop:544 length:447 start_codon:yes stop_codon:yes gene_type:complete